jgi:FKBP-type peptidyl-prolyl cis-trans isomerase 2
MAATAATGDTVQLHYTLTLDDGRVVDSSRERGPFQVTLGEGQVIKGFEKAVLGMTPGETKKVTVSAEEGYGPYRDELVQQVSREQIPPNVDVSVGQRLQASDQNGRTMVLTVIDQGPETVTLDANHPLAGEDLTFDVELLDVNKAA